MGDIPFNMYIHNIHVYMWVQVPPEAAHFSFRKVTALGVVCLTLLPSIFLPSHLSLTCVTSFLHVGFPLVLLSEALEHLV